jgi:hypothetical protein
VHATDIWLGKGVLGLQEADFHPLGVGHGSSASEARPFVDVVAARADRAAMVCDFLAIVTDDVLDEERRNPHDPAVAETVRSCLHVILDEGWEHLRFVVRDLEAVTARRHESASGRDGHVPQTEPPAETPPVNVVAGKHMSARPAR